MENDTLMNSSFPWGMIPWLTHHFHEEWYLDELISFVGNDTLVNSSFPWRMIPNLTLHFHGDNWRQERLSLLKLHLKRHRQKIFGLFFAHLTTGTLILIRNSFAYKFEFTAQIDFVGDSPDSLGIQNATPGVRLEKFSGCMLHMGVG